jgi:hypothetical protein
MLLRLGFRETTPEESRSYRESMERTDRMIAKQAARAGMSVKAFHKALLSAR